MWGPRPPRMEGGDSLAAAVSHQHTGIQLIAATWDATRHRTTKMPSQFGCTCAFPHAVRRRRRYARTTFNKKRRPTRKKRREKAKGRKGNSKRNLPVKSASYKQIHFPPSNDASIFIRPRKNKDKVRISASISPLIAVYFPCI